MNDTATITPPPPTSASPLSPLSVEEETNSMLAAILEKLRGVEGYLRTIRPHDEVAYLRGDQAAAAYVGLNSRRAFIALMRACGIKPRGRDMKLWRKRDLDNLPAHDAPRPRPLVGTRRRRVTTLTPAPDTK